MYKPWGVFHILCASQKVQTLMTSYVLWPFLTYLPSLSYSIMSNFWGCTYYRTLLMNVPLSYSNIAIIQNKMLVWDKIIENQQKLACFLDIFTCKNSKVLEILEHYSRFQLMSTTRRILGNFFGYGCWKLHLLNLVSAWLNRS